MAVGDAFVSWFDPTVICEPVWDGRQYLLACRPGDDVSMGSSLNEGHSPAPSKPTGRGGSRGSRGSGVVSQTAMRA